MYTKHFKDVVSTSLPADSESTAVDPDPSHFASLSIFHSLSTVEMDASVSFDLDLPIANQKGK